MEAGFSPDIVVTDGYNAYEQGLRVLDRRTEHVRAHFEVKLVHYDEEVIIISSNRIERYHSEIVLKVRCMRGIKNLWRGNGFF